MRRRFVGLLAAAGIAAASAQVAPRDPDAPPSVADPSIPLTYVGNDGSVSIGVNREGRTEGQLLGVFARHDTHAVVGQLWWDRAGAGGVQGDYNWLWGGNPIAAREHPDQATVSRLSFALDQNAAHDRKATLGFGIERRAFSVEAWLAHGVSGGRAAGHVVRNDPTQIGGSDDVGTWTQVDTTTIDTLFEDKPFGTEFGVQFSHVFEPMAMRLYGGASTQDGVGARATTLSLGLDTPLGKRGWGLSALAEHVRRTGGAGTGDDDRLSMFVRYEFGGHGSFAPTAQLENPAWISRSLARPSSAHSRTVESYRKVRSQSVSVTHGPRQYSNHFPVAQADSASTTEGVAVSIDVLGNDSDADGDALAINAVTAPAHGTAAISGTAILYTPAPGFVGTDTFAYTVGDGRGGSAGANVSVVVGARPNQAPIARDDAATTPFGQPVTVDALANDSDPDGDELVLLGVGVPAHGSAGIAGRNVLYTPAPGYSGSDRFTYTIGDGHGGTATATITITVGAPPNRPPIARDDTATTTVGQPVTIAMLANDADPDGDALTIATVGVPAHGSAAVSGGAVVYTPAAGYSGVDRFSYTISDGHGGTAGAFITVVVAPAPNRPPVAADDAATTAAGQPVTIPVLANDSDPDGDALTIVSVGAPAHGVAAIAGSAILYTPAAGYGGADAFSYTISDGRGGTATANVAVTVAAAPNRPPVAVDDAAATAFGQPVTIAVLTNDSDPDGDALTIVSVGAPAHGVAAIAGNAVLYTPATGFSGADTFAYSISDGHGGTATANVTVTVAPAPNQPPVAVADAATVAYLGSVTIPVLANDSDPDGDPLTIVSVSAPSFGTAAIAGNSIVYVSSQTAAVSGSDSFTYTISDGHGHVATATVTVTIEQTAPNQPPVAQNDAVATPANTPVVIDALANDSDPDGDPLTIVAVTQPANGTAAIATSGGILYTPNAGFFGTIDVFTYTISDGRGGQASAQVAVFVSG